MSLSRIIYEILELPSRIIPFGLGFTFPVTSCSNANLIPGGSLTSTKTPKMADSGMRGYTLKSRPHETFSQREGNFRTGATDRVRPAAWARAPDGGSGLPGVNRVGGGERKMARGGVEEEGKLKPTWPTLENISFLSLTSISASVWKGQYQSL